MARIPAETKKGFLFFLGAIAAGYAVAWLAGKAPRA